MPDSKPDLKVYLIYTTLGLALLIFIDTLLLGVEINEPITGIVEEYQPYFNAASNGHMLDHWMQHHAMTIFGLQSRAVDCTTRRILAFPGRWSIEIFMCNLYR